MGGTVLSFPTLRVSEEASNRVEFSAAEIGEMVSALEIRAVTLVRVSLQRKGRTVSDSELALYVKTVLHSAFLRKSKHNS